MWREFKYCCAMAVSLAAALALARPSPGAQAFSAAAIADPAARAAVEQILPRLDALAATEYTYVMTSASPARPGQPRLITRDECAFRPPFRIFQKSTQTRDLNGKQLIRTTFFIFDGKFLWMHASGQLGPGATLADIFPGMPEPLLEAAGQRELAPHVVKIDMERVWLETRFAPADYLPRLFVIPHLPFTRIEAASLALDEAPGEGLIALRARQAGGDDMIRFTFSGTDGRLLEIIQPSGEGATQVLQFSGYSTSPQLPPNHFTFHTPRGVPIRDATFALIESARELQSGAPPPADDALAVNVARSRMRLLSLAAAIEAWRLANNDYPERLEQLTTPVAYIQRIPDDPFRAGQPLRYQKLPGRNWMAWSVGPDGVDDGGWKELEVEKITPDDKGDIVRRKE